MAHNRTGISEWLVLLAISRSRWTLSAGGHWRALEALKRGRLSAAVSRQWQLFWRRSARRRSRKSFALPACPHAGPVRRRIATKVAGDHGYEARAVAGRPGDARGRRRPLVPIVPAWRKAIWAQLATDSRGRRRDRLKIFGFGRLSLTRDSAQPGRSTEPRRSLGRQRHVSTIRAAATLFAAIRGMIVIRPARV